MQHSFSDVIVPDCTTSDGWDGEARAVEERCILLGSGEIR